MIQFKRGKNKISVDFGLVDLYKFYKSKAHNPIDATTFKAVLKEYNNEILRLIIYDGLDYSMSHRLGSLRIKKFDNSLKLNEDNEVSNKLRPDWQKTKEKWRTLYKDASPEEIKNIPNKPIIFHLNEHTDGYVFRWHWDKVTCNLINQSAYKFRPVRGIKRLAAKVWKAVPTLKDIYYE